MIVISDVRRRFNSVMTRIWAFDSCFVARSIGLVSWLMGGDWEAMMADVKTHNEIFILFHNSRSSTRYFYFTRFTRKGSRDVG